jgi:LCP family protein required for cell wall assembly
MPQNRPSGRHRAPAKSAAKSAASRPAPKKAPADRGQPDGETDGIDRLRRSAERGDEQLSPIEVAAARLTGQPLPGRTTAATPPAPPTEPPSERPRRPAAPPPGGPPGTTPVVLPGPAPRSRTRRVLKWLAGGLAVVVLLTVVGGFVVYKHLEGNIVHLGISSEPKAVRPPNLTKAQNILLIGSDTRAFKGGAAFGTEVGGARSDTTILVHLSAGGKKAVLVSIPRDSYVQIPSCRITNGAGTATPGAGVSQPHMDKFNSAYSIGGPNCTIATVEALTHVRIDHFVEVNFQGFQRMVNALGGVNVCVRKPISDPIRYLNGHYIGSGLQMHAGVNRLVGKQALAFVRARYGIGDGSDIGRIKDQQLFISAVIRKATSAGLLVDIPRLYSFLDAATSSIRTDPGFSLTKLKALADRLHGLKPDKVILLTVPFVYDAPGVPSADIAWDPTRAPLLWAAIRDDQVLPGEVRTNPKPSASASPSAAPSADTLSVPPSAIHVTVLNGTGEAGFARRVAGELRGVGFDAGISYTRPGQFAQSVIRYGPTRADSARTLAAAVPGATLQEDPTLGSGLQLIAGANFTAVQAVHVAAPSLNPSASPSPSSSTALDLTNAASNVCAST